MKLILLALAAAQLAPAAPPAEQRMRECAALAGSNPAEAIVTANAWLAEGGGISARQCLGRAYVTQEAWAAAATVYEQAAWDAEKASDSRRADFWVQAANGWLAAGEVVRALRAIDAALAAGGLTNELRGEAHMDRARALVALNDLPAARQDMQKALDLVPADPFGWYLSAALARREGDLVRARSDINRALQGAPSNPDFLLLAGTLAGLAGDMAEAQRLYRRVVEVAPQSAAGRAAAESLGTEAAPSPPQAPQPR